jgi:hypothetical protein
MLSGFDYPITPTANLTPFLNLTTNSINCGISPMLNVTLLNQTAHDNYVPYQNFSYATIWSWVRVSPPTQYGNSDANSIQAPGEPRNYTSSTNAESDLLFRCATCNADLAGRWRVDDCSQKYFAACRAQNQPYNWTITSYPISYSYTNQACPDSYNFAAPRTALENSYLARAMRASHRDYGGHGAWVDFNSLDMKGCVRIPGEQFFPFQNVC